MSYFGGHSQASDQETPFFNHQPTSIFDHKPEANDQAYQFFNSGAHSQSRKKRRSLLSQLEEQHSSSEQQSQLPQLEYQILPKHEKQEGQGQQRETSFEKEIFSFEGGKLRGLTSQPKDSFDPKTKPSHLKQRLAVAHNSQPLSINQHKGQTLQRTSKGSSGRFQHRLGGYKATKEQYSQRSDHSYGYDNPSSVGIQNSRTSRYEKVQEKTSLGRSEVKFKLGALLQQDIKGQRNEVEQMQEVTKIQEIDSERPSSNSLPYTLQISSDFPTFQSKNSKLHLANIRSGVLSSKKEGHLGLQGSSDKQQLNPNKLRDETIRIPKPQSVAKLSFLKKDGEKREEKCSQASRYSLPINDATCLDKQASKAEDEKKSLVVAFGKKDTALSAAKASKLISFGSTKKEIMSNGSQQVSNSSLQQNIQIVKPLLESPDKQVTEPKSLGLRQQLKKFGSRPTQKQYIKSIAKTTGFFSSSNFLLTRPTTNQSVEQQPDTKEPKITFNQDKTSQKIQRHKVAELKILGDVRSERGDFGKGQRTEFVKGQRGESWFVRTMLTLGQVQEEVSILRLETLKANGGGWSVPDLQLQLSEKINRLLNFDGAK